MKTNASIYAQEPIITPERKVWRAVLGLAYEDAELALFSDGTEPEERVRARAFLRADSVHDVGAQGCLPMRGDPVRSRGEVGTPTVSHH